MTEGPVENTNLRIMGVLADSHTMKPCATVTDALQLLVALRISVCLHIAVGLTLDSLLSRANRSRIPLIPGHTARLGPRR